MTRRHALIPLLIALTVANPAFCQGLAQDAISCLGCHQKVLEEEYKHVAAVKNCMNCHKSNGNAHPAEGIKGFTLLAETPGLCYSCHEKIKTGSEGARYPHPVMTSGKNCLVCHSPHASSEKKLLLVSETKLCLGCHNKSVSAENKPIQNIRQIATSNTYTHGMISKTGCSGCHMPHGSPNPFILAGSYQEGIYTSVNKENFLVCFTCHKSELLLEENTTTATAFRNGSKNLHYLHIQGSKTRKCVSCHNVHGAMNTRLIAEKISFGKWEMPIQFRILDKGGSCAPGCHAEKIYKR